MLQVQNVQLINKLYYSELRANFSTISHFKFNCIINVHYCNSTIYQLLQLLNTSYKFQHALRIL